jgi:hypothetical protein
MGKTRSHGLLDRASDRLRFSVKVGLVASIVMIAVALVVGLREEDFQWSLGGLIAMLMCIGTPTLVVVTTFTYVQLRSGGLWRILLRQIEEKEKTEDR